MSKVFRFNNWDCLAKKQTYKHNDQIAIQLVGAQTDHNEKVGVFPGEPIAKVTVVLEDYKLPKDETFIKLSAEVGNALEVLVKEGIVEDLGVNVPCGYNQVRKVKVLI